MHPEYATPFWTNVKPVCGKCKLSPWRVCILWICEFNKNNSLLVTTKSNKENIYCDGKGSILSCLNNGRHVSHLLDFVIILIIVFWILKMSVLEVATYLLSVYFLFICSSPFMIYPCLPIPSVFHYPKNTIWSL